MWYWNFNHSVTIAAGDITGGAYTPGTGTSFTVSMTGTDNARFRT